MEGDDTEVVGKSTCPPATEEGRGGYSSAGGGGSHGCTDIEKEVFNSLLEKRIPELEVVADLLAFREELHHHFDGLPLRYAIDVNVDRAEDVLLHRRILNECADPEKRPIFHVAFLTCIRASVDSQYNTQSLYRSENGNCEGSQASTLRCTYCS